MFCSILLQQLCSLILHHLVEKLSSSSILHYNGQERVGLDHLLHLDGAGVVHLAQHVHLPPEIARHAVLTVPPISLVNQLHSKARQFRVAIT